MAITIKEVAELAGCSRGSVDRALKNSPKIKKVTKERIMKIVREYGYIPNAVGQALARSKKKYRIAVIVNSLGNDFFGEILRGLAKAEEEYAAFGILLSVYECERFSARRQLDAIEKIDWSLFNALIISALDDPALSTRLSSLAKKGIRIVAMNSDTSFRGKLSYVGCDYVQSGKTAGGLIKIVSRNDSCGLCVVTGSSQVLGHKQRVDGIYSVVRECANITDCGVISCDDNEKDAYDAVSAVLKHDARINILCGASGGVVGAARAVADLKRSIKIIAFDNTDKINALMKENKIIASINQQPFEQGFLAVKTLHEYDFGKTVPAKIITTDLIIKIRENL